MIFFESEKVELKKSTSLINQAIVSICAILNKHGHGELYFGVNNRGLVVGQDVSDNTLRAISQKISNHIDPKIFPTIVKLSDKNKNYVQVKFQGSDAPYFAFGRAYIRVADEDKLLNPPELEKLILEKNIYQSKWYSNPADKKFESINQTALLKFIKQINEAGRKPVSKEDPEIMLSKLGLIKGDFLTHAAWHLFCNNQPAGLQLAVFKGNDKTSFLDIKNFSGNLFDLLAKAEAYFLEKVNWKVEFRDDMKRHEIPEVPINAMREAIVNSFVHRNFNDPKSNEIAFFRDRIEIYNPGTFPPGLTPYDYFSGRERSILRNPKIAEMFYYTRDIDKWGSGFQRIKKECDNMKVDFQLEVLTNGFLTTFYRLNFDTHHKKQVIDSIAQGGIKGGIESGIKTTLGKVKSIDKPKKQELKIGGTKKSRKPVKGGIEKTETPDNYLVFNGKHINLPSRQKELLLIVSQQNSITIIQAANILNIAKSAAQKHFDALKRKGILKRVGSRKGGYWKILI